MNGLNWNAVRVRWEGGETAYSIAKTEPVSRQGIDHRAKREGWLRLDESTDYAPMVAAERCEIIKRPIQGSEIGKREQVTLAVILGAVSQGSSEGLAAKMAGIDPSTLTAWKREDPVLACEVGRARAIAGGGYIQCIHNASQTDWKAAAYMAERHPDTKGEFGRAAITGLPGPNIQINIER